MFQGACIYHVITFLKDFNKSFNTSDIDINRFARVLATLIEGALVLGDGLPVFREVVTREIGPDCVNVIEVVTTKDETSIAVIMDRL
jgi:hypothetical protein